MAYYSGTANSYADLKTALLTHAQADGWVLSGEVLSKNGVYFRIQSSASAVTVLGCTDNAVANPAPNVAQIGGTGAIGIAFPCTYEVFGFAQELYMVVKFSSDRYQWLAFGKSTIPGLPGTGAWCGATFGGGTPTSNITITPTGGGYPHTPAAAFWMNSDYYDFYKNCFVHSNLDGDGWRLGYAGNTNIPGVQTSLIAIQPSNWNSEAALLPLRSWKYRDSSKISLIAELDHARYIRIDNLSPGDILSLGADKWKVFPWHQKNISARDGGGGITHTGTFGWAIRYEGP